MREFAEDDVQLISTKEGETTLYIEGSQAMQGWESDLMELAADLMCGRGNQFLEAGLGFGISTMRIAKHPHVREHVVVEISRKVIELFRQQYPILPSTLKIVHGDFFDYVRALPESSVDGIFFDPALPMSMWNDQQLWSTVMPVIVRCLRPGGVFVPFFSTEPIVRKQYIPFFNEVHLVRHPFRTYRNTAYTHSKSGDAFIQIFLRGVQP